ncbi:amidohydrolase family protein [Pararobbsia silviterrae]|uniref:Amidohydrolase n=1 Tax=Pararobbsia silviterrae TaxID=1792498 RepID=A0A494Y588_9BURK|nr:amidohydrolase family protein [Pararobbsia silviterrae]RKP57848.1 amidohydrolase [Pararobbsia silviterrae]
MPEKLFDIHPHIISADSQRYPVSPLGGKRSEWSTHRPVDFEQLVAGMDEAGITKAAIVHSSTTYGYDNSYLADSIAEHQQRFTGVFSVDVRAADAPQRIRYWLDRGLSGLRLFAAGSTVKTDQSWIADPASYPAWEYCEQHGIAVAISMRQEGLPHLTQIAKRYPSVRIVLDHLLHAPISDGPAYAAATPMFEMAHYPNIYLKLTSAIIRRTQEGSATPESFFEKLLGAFGSQRIAWGSNYPAVEQSLPEIVAHGKATLAFLPQEDQENIFWRTAATLYPALADK